MLPIVLGSVCTIAAYWCWRCRKPWWGDTRIVAMSAVSGFIAAAAVLLVVRLLGAAS